MQLWYLQILCSNFNVSEMFFFTLIEDYSSSVVKCNKLYMYVSLQLFSNLTILSVWWYDYHIFIRLLFPFYLIAAVCSGSCGTGVCSGPNTCTYCERNNYGIQCTRGIPGRSSGRSFWNDTSGGYKCWLLYKIADNYLNLYIVKTTFSIL